MTESIYPENLLQAGCPVNGHPRQWFVLYTKPRQEHALARDLLRVQIPFYLPLVPHISLCGRRRLRSMTPLFAGYVFLLADEPERLRCLATHRVAQVLPVFDQERLHNDLVRLEQLIQTGMPLTVGTRSGRRDRNRGRRGNLQKVEDTGLREKEDAGVVVSVDVDGGGLSFEFTGEAPDVAAPVNFLGEGI